MVTVAVAAFCLLHFSSSQEGDGYSAKACFGLDYNCRVCSVFVRVADITWAIQSTGFPYCFYPYSWNSFRKVEEER